MFKKIAKHRANDASHDVHRPPLPKTGNNPFARISGVSDYCLTSPSGDQYCISKSTHNSVIFERNIDAEYYILIIQFMNVSKIYSIILPCQICETLHCRMM